MNLAHHVGSAVIERSKETPNQRASEEMLNACDSQVFESCGFYDTLKWASFTILKVGKPRPYTGAYKQ